MKALSVRAPWWWAILHGKTIENRDWYTSFRGRIFLHASKWWVKEDIALEFMQAFDMAADAGMALPTPDWAKMRAAGGCIVGSVEIVDCVRSSESPWFVGEYGFVLANPVTFARPFQCKGMLGLFEVPDCIEQLATGESKGNGVPAAMSADGLHQSDRSKTPAAEVLLGRMPAERRPRAAGDAAPQPAARVV